MHYADIAAILKKQGVTFSDIDRALQIHEGSSTKVARGLCKSRRVAKAIAAATGKSVDELWPGKYPQNYQLDRRGRAEAIIDSLLRPSQAA